MDHREQLRPVSFDEQRALEELQNLNREIQRARSDRERAEAEFDAFLRGFHEDPPRQDVAPRPKAPLDESPPPRVEQPQPQRIEPPPPPPGTRIEQPEPSRVEQPQRPQPPAAPPRVEQPQPPQSPAAPPPRPAPESPLKSAQPAFEAAPPPRALEPFDFAQGRPAPNPPPPLEPSAAPPAPFDLQPSPPAFQPVPFDFAQGTPFDTAQGMPFDTDPDTLPPPVVTDVSPLLVRPQRRQSLGAWIAIPLALIVLVAFVLMFRGEDTAPQSEITTAPPPATTPDAPPTDAPAAQTPVASAPASTTPPQAGVNLEMVTTRPVWVRVTIDGRREIERELPPGQRIPLRGERSILIRAGDAGAVTITRDGRDLGQLGEDAMPATREFKNTSPPASRQ